MPGTSNAKPDVLGDEPGGYGGFKALFGAKYVDPAIAGGSACVPDTGGGPITDPVGNCGFPGFDGMLAKNTLGYVESMQENGVPGDLRVHLGRARPARPGALDRLVLELGDGPGRDHARSSS